MLLVAGGPKFLNAATLLGFFEADTRTAAVSIDELDAGGLEGWRT
jgi:hypothetical protein